MANTFIEVKEVARQILPRLIENLVFPNLVHKDYSSDFVPGKGTKIQVKKPVVLTASDFDATNGVSAQDIKEDSVEVVLDHLATVDLEVGAIQMATNLSDFQAQVIEPAAIALAQKINSDGLDLYKDIPYCVGTAGTTPSSIDIFKNVRKELNARKVPMLGRKALWDTDADANFTTLDAILHAEKSGSTAALREGSIGRVFGLDNYMSQAVKTHTAGGAGTVLLAGAATKGAKTLDVDGVTGTFVKGDLFTIAGDATVYVVTSATDLSSTAQTIGIYPALAKNGADNAAITVKASHVSNLAFNEQAFAFVTRPLIAPSDKQSYVTSYNGISLRVVRGYDMKYKKEMISVDVLYGYKTMYPELAVRALG